MNSAPGSRSPGRTAASDRLVRWAPGLATLVNYRASWLTNDLLTGLVGAVAISLLLFVAPDLLRSLPGAALAAVVIAACLSFADVPAMFALYRLRRVEFALSLTSFVGVAFVGVIEGIFITIGLAMLVLVWNA